jgi:hypothetical protein
LHAATFASVASSVGTQRTVVQELSTLLQTVVRSSTSACKPSSHGAPARAASAAVLKALDPAQSGSHARTSSPAKYSHIVLGEAIDQRLAVPVHAKVVQASLELVAQASVPCTAV